MPAPNWHILVERKHTNLLTGFTWQFDHRTYRLLIFPGNSSTFCIYSFFYSLGQMFCPFFPFCACGDSASYYTEKTEVTRREIIILPSTKSTNRPVFVYIFVYFSSHKYMLYSFNTQVLIKWALYTRQCYMFEGCQTNKVLSLWWLYSWVKYKQ